MHVQLISLHMEHPWPRRGKFMAMGCNVNWLALPTINFPPTGATGVPSAINFTYNIYIYINYTYVRQALGLTTECACANSAESAIYF